MNWRALLETKTQVTYPWTGGRHLHLGARVVTVHGRPPREPGWYIFEVGTTAQLIGPSETDGDSLRDVVRGYLVGDHLMSRQLEGRGFCVRCQLFERSPCRRCGTRAVAMERIHLAEPLPLFTLVSAGRTSEAGPLIYRQIEFSSGVEDEVRDAFDRGTGIENIKGVPYDLRAAYELQVQERQRIEEVRRHAEILRVVGTAEGRRALADTDYETAAKEALRVSGAVLLSVRPSPKQGEHFVRFRFLDQNFEAVADDQLRIVDAGICLTAHDYDQWEDGTRGDTWFTLESLPDVIREARDLGVLVVMRHA
jgi:hypothetical protein